MPYLAIIIPCYNEEKRLNADAFIQMAKKHSDWLLIFVNDGSTDNTKDNLIKIKATAPGQIHIVELSTNQGKGEAVRQGALLALQKNYEYIAYLDADLATPVEEFIRLTKLIGAATSVLIGSRIKKADTLIFRSGLRHLAGRSIATLIDFRFGLGIYDTQCGAKIFKASMLEKSLETPFKTSWLFDVELFLRLKSHFAAYTVHEEPLQLWKDDGKSKLSIFSFPLILKELFILLSKY